MPFDAPCPSVPHAREDPPWADCGDPKSDDFGTVFARAGAAVGSLVLTFDRAGARHAATLADAARVGAQIVLFGRRFDVMRL